MRLLKDACRSFLSKMGYEVYRSPAPMTLNRSLLQIFENRKIDYVIDIGAHYGLFGDQIRALGYKGQIASFEPMSETAHTLEQHVAEDDHWRVFPYAIGEQSGQKKFNIMGGDDLCSFAEPNKYCSDLYQARGRVQSEVEVSVKTLEDALQDLDVSLTDHQVFLKLDTQGWDMPILQAAEAILPGFAAIQFEASMKPIYHDVPRYFQACEFIENLGFHLCALHPFATEDLAIIEADCLFVRTVSNGKKGHLDRLVNQSAEIFV